MEELDSVITTGYQMGRWARTKPPSQADDVFEFQMTQITYSVDAPRDGGAPEIQLWGCTAGGNSAVVRVRNFRPYMWAWDQGDLDVARQNPTAVINAHIASRTDVIGEDIGRYNAQMADIQARRRAALAEATSSIEKGTDSSKITWRFDREAHTLRKRLERPDYSLWREDGCYVTDARLEMRRELQRGGMELAPFWRVELFSPKYIGMARKALRQVGYRTYEDKLPYILRFLCDKDAGGHTWFRASGCTPTRGACSTCQYDLTLLDPEQIAVCAGRSDSAPLRIMSFDIECVGTEGFPNAELPGDQVISICSYVYDETAQKPLCATQFSIGSCAEIPRAPRVVKDQEPPPLEQYTFDSEADMLAGWAAHVADVDPDVFTGYNINSFDWVYLLDRTRTLRMAPSSFATRISRDPRHEARYRRTEMTTKAYGTKVSHEVTVWGREQLDLLDYVKKECHRELRSKKLDSVAEHYMGMRKEVMDYAEIPLLQAGSPKDRARLNYYCLKDAGLPVALCFRLTACVRYTEMARVTGVPRSYLTSRGEQIKTMSLLVRRANTDDRRYVVRYQARPEGTFTGGVVLQPTPGLYNEAVAILDFASLYPSIMMEKNLCYSTIESLQYAQSRDDWVEDTHYWVPPVDNVDYCFVQRMVREGVLPRILRTLVDARRAVKKEMEGCPYGSVDYTNRDSRQLALKITGNSVYGFTSGNMVFDVRISQAVTARGRWMIFAARDEITRWCLPDNGYPPGVRVIYGDTDSVFVVFDPTVRINEIPVEERPATLARLAALASRAAKHVVAKWYGPPHDLELESFYGPLMITSKKRYACIPYTWDAKKREWAPGKLKVMGLDSKRKDNCLLVPDAQKRVLELVLRENDTAGAIRYCHEVIAALLRQQVPLHKLVISRGISKKLETYKAPVPPHIALAYRLRQRNPETAPRVGDRIPYIVIAATARHAKTGERTEDPIVALNARLDPDPNYYMYNQLMKPIIKVLAPALEKPDNLRAMRQLWDTKERKQVAQVARIKLEHTETYKRLFTGPHMLVRKRRTAKDAGGAFASMGIASWVKPLPQCAACGVRLHDTPATGGKQIERESIDGKKRKGGRDQSPAGKRRRATVCERCEESGKRAQCLKENTEKLGVAKARAQEIWTYCIKTCQSGNEETARACTNANCSNYTERMSLALDIEDLDALRAKLQ